MKCSLWVSNKEEKSDIPKYLELLLTVLEAFPPLPYEIEPPSYAYLGLELLDYSLGLGIFQ